MKTMVKTVCRTAALAAWVAAVPAQAASGGAAAWVNGEAVSWREFDRDWRAFLELRGREMPPERMTPEWKRSCRWMLLDEIIDQRLLLQAARKRKLAGGPRSAVAALRDRVLRERVKPPAPPELRRAYRELRERLAHPGAAAVPGSRSQAAIDALARELRPRTAARVKLRYILLRLEPGALPARRAAALARAGQVHARLEAGADFADMARRYSDDTTSPFKSGQAGFVLRGELPDRKVEDAIFSLPLGAVSGVIRGKPGYEIFRVEEKRAAAEFGFEAARPALEESLRRSAAREQWALYIRELEKAAPVSLPESLFSP